MNELDIRSMIKDIFEIFRRKNRPPPEYKVLIPGVGICQVTESARLQAVANMIVDPAKREEVRQIVIRQMGGSTERGDAEFRRRFPELFELD
jgi:hypothetical protein